MKTPLTDRVRRWTIIGLVLIGLTVLWIRADQRACVQRIAEIEQRTGFHIPDMTCR